MPDAVVPAQFPALERVSHADVLPVGVDRESSRAAGFAAGFAAGARAAARAAEATRRRAAAEREAAARQAADRLETALAVLEAAADAARARAVPVLADAEEALHDGALELARAVLDVRLRDEDTAVAAALSRVRAAAELGEAVEVRLNPADLAALADLRPPVGVVLVADPALGRGEALARHEEGWLDGRIDEAVRRARAALDGAP